MPEIYQIDHVKFTEDWCIEPSDLPSPDVILVSEPHWHAYVDRFTYVVDIRSVETGRGFGNVPCILLTPNPAPRFSYTISYTDNREPPMTWTQHGIPESFTSYAHIITKPGFTLLMLEIAGGRVSVERAERG